MTAAGVSSATASSAGSAQAFEFVKLLARELSAGTVELPSFPDVALRVQRVLADDSVTPDRVVRVVGTEPALASRILRMANSVALNVSRVEVVDLRTAIARMGFDMLRSAALSFAMAQLRHAERYKPIAQQMQQLWDQSMHIGAMCYVVAKRCTKLSPDSAMLSGVLHGVGKLYIMARAIEYPDLFNDPSSLNQIIADWHMNIAKALLENWGMAEELVAAVHAYEDQDATAKGPVTLTDVLALGALLAAFDKSPALLAAKLVESRSAARLGVDAQSVTALLSESEEQLHSLLEALSA